MAVEGFGLRRCWRLFSFLFFGGGDSGVLEDGERNGKDGDGASGQAPKNKYWTAQSADEVIAEADRLYARGQFLEVYELLNRLKFNDSAEVQWRISRSLFKMSLQVGSGEQRREMIQEAHQLIKRAMGLDARSSNVYKWSAIIGDARAGLEGLEARVAHYGQAKEMLQRAIDLNPSDSVSYYMLGRWCFAMSKLSWMERFLARCMYGAIPEATFEEAYHYLKKSSDMNQQAYYVPSMYMLGEACFRMGQYYRARFYLNVAATLPARTDYEKQCADEARHLLKRLEVYDLSKETVLFEYPF